MRIILTFFIKVAFISLGGNLRNQVVGIAGILVEAGIQDILRQVVGRIHVVADIPVVVGIHVAVGIQGILHRVVGDNIREVEVLVRQLQADGVRGPFGAAAVVDHRHLDRDRE